MIVLFAVLLLTTEVSAQIRQIDLKKLPQDQTLQKVYSDTRLVEPMTRSWSPAWAYDKPESEVVALLSSGLRVGLYAAGG